MTWIDLLFYILSGVGLGSVIAGVAVNPVYGISGAGCLFGAGLILVSTESGSDE